MINLPGSIFLLPGVTKIFQIHNDSCPQLSCPSGEGGSGGGGGRGGKSKMGRLDRNSDNRLGHSHMSNSVRGVGYEEQEKTWMVVWGSNPQEGQRRLETSPRLLR